MQLMQPLEIRSGQVLLLSKLKKDRNSLIDAVSFRICNLLHRVQQQELFAIVDLYQLNQKLAAFEKAMRKKENEYKSLIEKNHPAAKDFTYKTLKKMMCSINTPYHSLWVSALASMDNVFCAIYTLKIHHASSHRVSAGTLIASLNKECQRWAYKLAYFPSREAVFITNYLELTKEARAELLAKNKITLEELTTAVKENITFIPEEHHARLILG